MEAQFLFYRPVVLNQGTPNLIGIPKRAQVLTHTTKRRLKRSGLIIKNLVSGGNQTQTVVIMTARP